MPGGGPLVARIALVGLPGSGKSAVAPLLARRLECPCVDLDLEIERLAGRAVAAIFEEEGEERFRDLESLALAQALGGPSPVVVACGGGILGRASNRDLLKSNARVVWLDVDPAKAAERLRSSGQPMRPVLLGASLEERLRALLESRREGYEGAAELVVDTGGFTPNQVAEVIATALAGKRRWEPSGS